jgi:hypothetical protein
MVVHQVHSGENTDENSFHVINLANGLNLTSSAILDGFIIQGGITSMPGKSIFDGGGLYCENNSPLIRNCIFRNNFGYNGGAVFVTTSSDITFTNCLITNNKAEQGAGFYVYDNSSLTLINTTLSNNKAEYGGGGGIYSDNSNIYLDNSIIWANEASSGAQIYYNVSTKAGFEFILNNACISKNEDDIFDEGNLLTENSCIYTDPQFVDPANDDYRIYGTSPCVDAGNDPYNVLLTDIRGFGFNRKIQNSKAASGIDMGAYEYNSAFDPFSGCTNPTSGGTIGPDQNICYNTTPAVLTSSTPPTGHVGTLEYQWQISTVSPTFVDIPGAASETYSIVGTITQTTWFRRLARVTCDPVGWASATASNVVEVTVRDVFNAGAINTTGETICYGEVPLAITSLTDASGGDENITYLWESSSVSASTDFEEILGTYTATYNPSTATQTTWYRRSAKDGACNTTYSLSSGVWKITVFDELQPGTATGTQTICYGETPSALIASEPTGGSPSISKDLVGYTYQWEQHNGIDWEIITTATNLSYQPGTLTTTTTFRLAQIDTYCNPEDVVYTNEVIITVFDELTPGTATGTQTICYGQIPAAFEANAPSGGSLGTSKEPVGYTYQWQKHNGIDWDDVQSAEALIYQPGTLTQTTTYRLAQSDAYCNPVQTVYTTAVTVTVLDELIAGTASGTQTICYGTTPQQLSATAPTGGHSAYGKGPVGYTYQWQYKSVDQKYPDSWIDILLAEALTYQPGTLTQTTTYRFSTNRCVLQSRSDRLYR